MPNLRRLLHEGPHDDATGQVETPAPDCPTGDPWLWHNLHQCVEGPQQLTGFVTGVLAIAVWILIHILLLRLRYEQYTTKKTSSILLVLVHATAPNCLSLLGAILSQQLSTQIMLACYLILGDLVFWCYLPVAKLYKNGRWCFKSCKDSNYNYEKDRNMNNLVLVTPFAISFMYLASWLRVTSQWTLGVSSNGGSGLPVMTHRTRILLHAHHDDFELASMDELLQKAGYAIGILAVILTWSALLHQSQWVFQEKKVPKANYLVTVLMILADVFYLVSIFTQSVETDFLLHTLPWTLTRIGTIGLNVGVLFQAHLNVTQRLAGHEIDKDVAMVLRSEGNKSGEDTDEEERSGEDCPLLEVPKKNKYIRKMRRIARQIEKQDKGQSSEDELFSDDDAKKPEIPQSDVELDLDLNDETLQRELTNEEVYELLAAEDRQESIVPGGHQTAVLQIKTDSPTDTSVIYFNEETEAPPTPDFEPRTSLKDYHQTVFLDDSLASVDASS